MKPLTIEELKALPVGGWVWLKILKIINIVAEDNGIVCRMPESFYCKKFGFSSDEESIFYCNASIRNEFCYSDYGTKWIAYKNKEAAEEKEQCVICHKGISSELPKIDIYGNHFCGKCYLDKCEKELLQEKEARGEIVKLPDKTETLHIGDTVYYVQEYYNDATLQHERQVKRTKIDYIAKDYIEVNNGVWLSINDFWLIPEEAERRLAELKGEKK